MSILSNFTIDCNFNGKLWLELASKYKFHQLFWRKEPESPHIYSKLLPASSEHIIFEFGELLLTPETAHFFFDSSNSLELLFREKSVHSIIYIEKRAESDFCYSIDGIDGFVCLRKRYSPAEKINTSLYENIDIDLLCDAYLKSNSPLLILTGKPGCGKTSIIKYLSNKFKKTLLLVSSEQIMYDTLLKCDTSNLNLKNTIIIIDDVYKDLGAREGFVEKVCQLTSGLYPDINKIVITSNQEWSNIDSALIRPGRCFDMIELSYLSPETAKVLHKQITNKDRSFDAEISQADFVEIIKDSSTVNDRSYIKKSSKPEFKKIGFHS